MQLTITNANRVFKDTNKNLKKNSMNKSEKKLTKRQLLKVLPNVREIYVGIGIGKNTLNNITISKAQFKRLLDIADSNEILDKIELITLENGIFIII